MLKHFIIFVCLVSLKSRYALACAAMKSVNTTDTNSNSSENGSSELNTGDENNKMRSNYDTINITEVMSYCNESFRTSMNYLRELNTTGSFPDELDKTPMCFLRCYLENVGILSSDGKDVNRTRAVQMLWATAESSIEDCEGMVNTENLCEKAYDLAKCVLTRALVDGRVNDNDN